MCCIGFGTSHDVLQELLEAEQCWQRLEDEETSSHELSMWRLRTPTICRRSVPALCNAGLPKKKTLQQGNIDKENKSNRLSVNDAITRVSSPATYWRTIYNQRGFHLNAIQGHAYQGMVGLHMCVPEIFGLIAFSWLLRRIISCSCSSSDETAS